MSKKPLVFDEFFDLGQPDSASPFLTQRSRSWGFNLSFKLALLSAALLLISFILSWYEKTVSLSNLVLLGVYFSVGIPFLIESIESIADWEINIDVLMTLAAFSSVLIGSGMEGGLLLVLFAISGSMEEVVTTKAKGAIKSLHKLSPAKACVVEDNGIVLERSIRDIDIGTKILVKSGEIVPLDGVVVSGSSSVNTAHLTGESLPISKKIGDEVPSGALNQEGALILRVAKTGNDSTLARIIELVTQAQDAKPQLQRWFDKLSTRYASSIILFSLIFALAYPWIAPATAYIGKEGSIYRSLAFLIAASPCALIIAIPIAYLSGISVCARKGVILKGGIVLDDLASCSAMAFDKTGTLTLGELSCIGIEPLEKDLIGIEKVLAIAYAMEKNAVHPIAKAISSFAKKEKAENIVLEDYKSVPGYGLQGSVKLNDKVVSVNIGNLEYIESLINSSQKIKLDQRCNEIKERGELITILNVDQQIYLFKFLDLPRPKVKETLDALKAQRMSLVMLTGDHAASAKKVANQLGIDFLADLRPEDKLNNVDRLSQERGLVMIGDGINDAPALARATVGIAMGKVGSATAVEASDIVFLNDNIEILPWLMKKAKMTRNIVRQNLFIAAGAILVATIPALSGYIPLWAAVIMHEGGTVLVGLNALRILRR